MDKQELPKELGIRADDGGWIVNVSNLQEATMRYQAALKQLEEARKYDLRRKIPNGNECVHFDSLRDGMPNFDCPFRNKNRWLQKARCNLKDRPLEYNGFGMNKLPNCPKPPIERS